MKKIPVILLLAFTLIACNKERYIDYSEWYKNVEVADDREQMKVMSFNFRNDDGSETPDKQWSTRVSGICAMLKETNPVVVGGQELRGSNIENVLSALPQYSCYGRDLATGGELSAGGEADAIFYLKDSVEVLDKGVYWLSKTPDEAGSKYNDSAHLRQVTWMHLKKIETGSEFFAFNTHLDNKGEQARVQSIKLITSKLKEINPDNLPMILTGDFNQQAESSIFTGFVGDVVLNARTNASFGDAVYSYNDWGGKAVSMIDYIFYQGFYSVPTFKTINSSWAGVNYISDHWPIVATLKFK